MRLSHSVPRGKRASANMWWIIIGAVVALVVLIVLMVIFTDKTGELGKGLSSCEGKGGICVNGDECPGSSLNSGAFECVSTHSTCCIGAPKEQTADNVCDKGIVNGLHDKKYCK